MKHKIQSALAVLALVFAGSAAPEIKVKWSFTDKNSDVTSHGYGMARDGNGDFYVVGSQLYSNSPTERYRTCLEKISSFRQYPDWTRTLNGTGASIYEDSLKAVAVDPDGWGAVAGGTSWSATKNGPQAMLVFYFYWGATAWIALPDADSVESVAVSGGSSSVTSYIYAVGIKKGPAGNNTDIWYAKYAYNGFQLDSQVYIDPFNVDDGALAVAVSPAGFVYIAGYRTVAGQGRNIWLGKFDADLNPLWGGGGEININGPASSTDFAASITLGPSGEIYLSGAVTQSATFFLENLDVWVARINDNGGSGSLVWSFTMDGGELDNDAAWGVTVDSSGILWSTGSLDTPGSQWADLWLGKFSSAGLMLDSWRKDFTGNGDDIGRGIVVSPLGPVVAGYQTDIIAGESLYLAQFWEWFPSPSIPPDFINAYPNPFRPGSGGPNDAKEIVIRSLPPGCVLRFYTLSGALVRQITDWDGNGIISWDAKNDSGKNVGSGVYIFAATASGSGTKKGKVVIIR